MAEPTGSERTDGTFDGLPCSCSTATGDLELEASGIPDSARIRHRASLPDPTSRATRSLIVSSAAIAA